MVRSVEEMPFAEEKLRSTRQCAKREAQSAPEVERPLKYGDPGKKTSLLVINVGYPQRTRAAFVRCWEKTGCIPAHEEEIEVVPAYQQYDHAIVSFIPATDLGLGDTIQRTSKLKRLRQCSDRGRWVALPPDLYQP
jgi:hypothetical protein